MYPGNIGSTNQTAPRRVAFRKRSRGEKQNIPNCLRNVAAAMCSCFGCVLRQNQKGELEAASWAREWTMIDRGRREEPTVVGWVCKTQNSLTIELLGIFTAITPLPAVADQVRKYIKKGGDF